MSENHEDGITIVIDKKDYHTTHKVLNGIQLRNLPAPPIGSDYDLIEIVSGGTDLTMGDHQEVQLKNGAKFFSAPKVANPGR